MKKNNRGITLIALVITIIVLLILVGVTLAMISGDSSIFKKAVAAKEETFVSQAKEVAGVVVSEAIADYYDAKYVNKNSDAQKSTILAYIEDDIEKKATEYSDWLTFDKAKGVFTIKGYETTKAEGGYGKITGTINDNGYIKWELDAEAE